MNETYISGALHEIADLDGTSVPPVQHLLHRGHRARAARNGGMAAVAVLAVAAIGVPLAAASHHTGGPAPVAKGNASPTATTVDSHPSLVLAALTSAKTSFKASWTVTMPDGPATGYTGVFDPGHGLSDMTVASGSGGAKFYEQRRIGTDCYTKPTPKAPWQKYTCRDRGAGVDPADGVLDDPGAVLERLKSSGSAVYAGRQGSVDTWTFTYTIPAQETGPAQTVTGKVTVDVPSNRVASVSESYPTQSTPATITYTFSDYGTAVTVTAP